MWAVWLSPTFSKVQGEKTQRLQTLKGLKRSKGYRSWMVWKSKRYKVWMVHSLTGVEAQKNTRCEWIEQGPRATSTAPHDRPLEEQEGRIRTLWCLLRCSRSLWSFVCLIGWLVRWLVGRLVRWVWVWMCGLVVLVGSARVENLFTNCYREDLLTC